ncbi:uncharacterized protein BKA78DRAFT_252558 [Phyllosticta capitalensis]|uniref:uncharacterized protein n=1 Tax=Phyllosticta capitalensis TaxID=121624 RepID=UPI0031304DD1
MPPPINYVAYVDARLGVARVGHLDFESDSITPLTFKSGTSVASLYQVIEAGDEHIAAPGVGGGTSEDDGPAAFPASSVKLLPPLAGRDVLAVGKNYSEHAAEFNRSGYDSSDKVDQPTHPVIFTKRATSIIAHGDEIYAHPEFTQSLDYEGELGLIIGRSRSGKSAFRVSEEEAWDHVWGFTIINDVTARERQRDHKQFFVGKSADTTCPMGPVAVAKEHLPGVLRVQTFVNGEPRQDATTEDLIFSIPFLIKTISEGMTIHPGDVIATGTPAGVGIGMKPPVFLKAGDEIAISITGLGTLRNSVTDSTAAKVVNSFSTMARSGHNIEARGECLAMCNGRRLYWRGLGQRGAERIVFLHDLGATSDSWMPLIKLGSLEDTHSLIVFDFEGHGLSPTEPLDVLSLESFSEDLKGVLWYADVSEATLVAHGMGCLVALTFVRMFPKLAIKLILINPPPLPLPAAYRAHARARSWLARTRSLLHVAEEVASSEISEYTSKNSPLAVTALNLSIRGQDTEGYAKACTAIADTDETLDILSTAPTAVIVGGAIEPEPSRLDPKDIPHIRHFQLPNVGQWAVFEDPVGLARAVKGLL